MDTAISVCGVCEIQNDSNIIFCPKIKNIGLAMT